MMLNAIRAKAVVQPGGRIELRAPELLEGAEAEVIVIVNGAAAQPPRLSDMVGSAKGTFGSVEEIDRYIRELRDEWD